MTESRASTKESLRAAALPWVVSRFLALTSLAFARFLVSHFRLHTGHAESAAHAGLLGADAAWYRQIAAHGYGAGSTGPVRFFPLYPLMARGLGELPGISVGAAQLVISNAAALAAFALLYAVVVHERGDERTARLSVWMVAVAPASFVLTMGYAEALLLVLSLAVFLAIRRGAFAWAIPAAFLAGACRPVGILLAGAALIEFMRARDWIFHSSNAGAGAGITGASSAGAGASSAQASTAGARGGQGLRATLAQIGSVLAAPAGAAAYFGYVVASGRGSFFAPLRQQLSPSRRGAIADPVVTLAHDLKDLAHLQHLGTALHAPWVVVFVALGVVVLAKLPASYGLYTWLTLAVTLTAPNLDSLERYGLICFPLAIAAAIALKSRPSTWAILPCLGAAALAYGALAFLGAYVP